MTWTRRCLESSVKLSMTSSRNTARRGTSRFGKRFVEEDVIRGSPQRVLCRLRYTLAFAAGSRTRFSVEQAIEAKNSRDGIHALVRACARETRPGLAHGEDQVAVDRQMRSRARRVLKDHRHVAAMQGSVVIAMPSIDTLPDNGRLKTSDQPEDRALARPGRAEQNEQLSRGDRQIDRPDCIDPARINLCQLVLSSMEANGCALWKRSEITSRIDFEGGRGAATEDILMAWGAWGRVALVGVSTRAGGWRPGGDAGRRGRHSHAGAWERGVLRWLVCRPTGSGAREGDAERRGTAFPRGRVGTRYFVLRWLLCRPTGERRRGATRSVGDGVPTRERGNEVCCVGSVWSTDWGASARGATRGVGDGIPTRSVGTSCAALVGVSTDWEWRWDAERRARHSHAGRGNELLLLGCRVGRAGSGGRRRGASRTADSPRGSVGNELCAALVGGVARGGGARDASAERRDSIPRGSVGTSCAALVGVWTDWGVAGATRSVGEGIPTQSVGTSY